MTVAEPDSLLSRLLRDSIPQCPQVRARTLEDSVELEQAYAAAATKGDSAVPGSAEDEVDFHYICFTRSDADGCLYELDGDSKGPIALGPARPGDQGDVLGPEAIARLKEYIGQEDGNIGFNLMALVHSSD